MAEEETFSATVLRARSGFYTVRGPDGALIESRIPGRLRRERQASDLAVIGDRVTVRRLSDGSGQIERVEPRRSRFGRRQPGPRGAWREDVMVANVDLVAAVFACAHPDPKPRLIDRFLVVAEHNEVAVLVVANKVDRVGMTVARKTFGPYERLGYQVAYTSAISGQGVEELRARLSSRLAVVAGPSGVGKSTLLNAMQPGLGLATADVSDSLGKGRHTTRVAELHPLDTGYVADTPGIRELGLWQIPAEDIAWCFLEFRPHLGQCGFNDCTHRHEPRCAIRAAVSSRSITAERYDSYLRLHAES